MMKAIHGILFLTLFGFGAQAQEGKVLKNDEPAPPAHEQTDGYRGIEDARIMTVKQALAMHQGASVSLRGNLIQETGKDRYLLRDRTGEVEVMIPQNVAGDRQVSPDHLMSVSGTLEKKGDNVHIVAHRFQKE
ncbi:NirD/YgiW/YdeI family stress tolerance protein [Atlantibacter sp.]|uniref:NirD/YgiW/YdeI family stress tolerance protein n=1 Tax=Atlantibacter sp. TaxID=1903473 RepID=UPI0028AB0FE1|nr:NirD/YgiW/YdeI family stress tolerance protein [Atlantibacter sp.]